MWSAKPGVTLTQEQRQTADALMPIVHIGPTRTLDELLYESTCIWIGAVCAWLSEANPAIEGPLHDVTANLRDALDAYRDAQSAREGTQTFQRTGAGDQAS